MKKLSFVLFFLLFFFVNICSAGLKVGYLSPANPIFSSFSSSFLDGLYLGLSSDETVVVQNNSKGVASALENLYLFGVDAIVGPFESYKVEKAKDSICNSSIVTILPFANAEYFCSNLFTYNYNPIRAAQELAKIVSDYPLGKTLVLYAYDNLDIAKKDAFLDGLQSHDHQLYVKGFLKSRNYGDYIRSLFGVRKMRETRSLTEGGVYKHSFDVDSIVIFAPQRDFVNIANLIDYYSINPKNILSTDIIVNNNLLSLSNNILKKMEFITPYYLCSEDKINMNFVRRFEVEYQSDPNFMSALGYDIGRLLSGADRVSLQSKLKQTSDFDGLIGRLLLFNDKNRGLINYKLLTYKDIKKCRKMILSK